jgi:hypothetical protein
MRRFACPACGSEVFFDSLACMACATGLAYDAEADALRALDGEACANRAAIGCNWAAPGGGLCTACALTGTVPDLSVPGNRGRWARIEGAKRRLVRQILRLGLPLSGKDGARLRFALLADEVMADGSVRKVLTGHDDGLVTLNVAEADDDAREAMRRQMGEPYRTLLGHCRHEVGHFYYDALVEAGGRRDAFAALFGDPDADYQAALDRHYREGAPEGWQDSFVSAYATMHPWEDFAETFAHWLHLADGLGTARAWGLSEGPDPLGEADTAAVVAAWIDLSLAMNATNRAMGQPDFYPFVLAPKVVEKLAFVRSLMPGRAKDGG